MPNSVFETLSLQDIFFKICRLDSERYFMCNMEDFKYLAEMIEHIPLELRVRYVFCCAPIQKNKPFVSTMFMKVTGKNWAIQMYM